VILTEDLILVFQEKLAKTGSLDAALTKALWVAYKAGVAEGRTPAPVDLTEPK
jgi:hypothetical protein